MVGISPRGESLFPVTCCRFGHNGSLTEAPAGTLLLTTNQWNVRSRFYESIGW